MHQAVGFTDDAGAATGPAPRDVFEAPPAGRTSPGHERKTRTPARSAPHAVQFLLMSKTDAEGQAFTTSRRPHATSTAPEQKTPPRAVTGRRFATEAPPTAKTRVERRSLGRQGGAFFSGRG